MSEFKNSGVGSQNARNMRGILLDISSPVTTRITKLPARDKAVLLYGGAIATLILLYSFIIDPLLIRYSEIKSEIIRTTERVDRFQSVLDTTEDNQDKRREYTSEFESVLKLCFEGETEDIAAGKLVERTRVIASQLGLTLKSTKVENSAIVPGFRELNVNISFDASFPSLLRFIQNIEESDKTILIRDAKIHSLKETYASTQEETLSIELLLSGLQYIP